MEKKAGNCNVEGKLSQPLADIKVNKVDFRGKESESDEKNNGNASKNSEESSLHLVRRGLGISRPIRENSIELFVSLSIQDYMGIGRPSDNLIQP